MPENSIPTKTAPEAILEERLIEVQERVRYLLTRAGCDLRKTTVKEDHLFTALPPMRTLNPTKEK